jgi:hypothetical protein
MLELDVTEQRRPDPDLGTRREGEWIDQNIKGEPRGDYHFAPFAKDHLTRW